jgi:hypothetical protein
MKLACERLYVSSEKNFETVDAVIKAIIDKTDVLHYQITAWRGLFPSPSSAQNR